MLKLLLVFKVALPLTAVSLWPAPFILCGDMLAFPAETAALKADAVVAAVTLEQANALGASTAKVAIVELESSLLEFFLATDYLIEPLHTLIGLQDLAEELHFLVVQCLHFRLHFANICLFL